MQDYLKFLKKLPKSLRIKIIQIVELIAEDALESLDIKRLKGTTNVYRCRVGKVRIVFEKRAGENVIHDIGFRGEIY